MGDECGLVLVGMHFAFSLSISFSASSKFRLLQCTRIIKLYTIYNIYKFTFKSASSCQLFIKILYINTHNKCPIHFNVVRIVTLFILMSTLFPILVLLIYKYRARIR